MALITCSNCGKQVSDTADLCVHCGAELIKEHKSATMPKSKIFSTLSDSEQKELKKEFKALMPKYDYATKRQFIFMWGSLLSLLLALIVGIVGSSLNIGKTFKIIMIVFMILFGVLGALFLILHIANRGKAEKDELMYIKLFSLWLKQRKNIEFPFSFTEKQQLIFDNLTISEEDKWRIENG